MDRRIHIGDVILSFEEAEETLRAIRAGRIDAVVVRGEAGDEVYTFRDPGHPYRLLVEEMSEGAVLATSDGIIGYHNQAFARLLGIEGGPLVGKPLAELVAPADRARLAALFERSRFGPARVEVELIGGGGQPLAVQLSAARATLADVPVFCVIAADLREHRRQEELYRLAREEIESRDRLFSVAAHELRGPLSVIRLQSELLIKLLREGRFAPERAVAMAERLEGQGVRLAALIDKLLVIGTIGAGRLALSRESLDLAHVVRTVVEHSAELLRQSGSQLTVELEPVEGLWDRVRLEQVVANLLGNAIKYGLGRPIRVAVARAGTKACLTVEDQGAGIPPEARERIFRPYERMGETPGASGLGLGLYIAAEIVKAHGGSIRVDGEPGHGSRFVVELPLAPAHGWDRYRGQSEAGSEAPSESR